MQSNDEITPTTVDDLVSAEMDRRRIPGVSFAVTKHGEIIKAQGYGLADLEHDVPVTEDTVFYLASLTKLFTATAIMLLVQDGQIDLDDAIGEHIANSPETWRGITVRHLLAHTSGLPLVFGGSEPSDYSTEELFQVVSRLPLEFAPGEQCLYSNPGYWLLGMIIEQVSGTSYRQFLNQRIFDPLGMTKTTITVDYQIVKHRSPVYTIRDGKHAYTSGRSYPELPAHGGALWSTPYDLAKLDASLYSDTILTRASLEQMLTPSKLNDGSQALFEITLDGHQDHHQSGLGWRLGTHRGHNTAQHSGSTGTYFLRFPDAGLTVIWLSNLMWTAGSDPRKLSRMVADLYLE
jgi:CubicO group peptidase (beta-lactamase class C family)